MDLESQIRTLERGTVDILGKDRIPGLLSEGRALNVKFGIDPTAPDVHLGHTVPLQKLRQFQEMGHNIHLIIGNYTAMIGDPSGRSETRPILTQEQIEVNVATYSTQVFKLLDPQKTSILYNADWLGKFSGLDMIQLASKYTVQQLLQRRDFNNRMKQHKPLSVAEMIYPLLVGYDSVHLKTDIEIGGTDQLFNFVASREIQGIYGQTPEVVITLPLLEGTDGEKKMSKSYGNSIGVKEAPSEIYGKVMSIPDKVLIKYFELLSDVPLLELDEIKQAVGAGTANPMRYKQMLARELVGKYHGLDAAVAAEECFNAVHRARGLPKGLELVELPYVDDAGLKIVSLLRSSGKVDSNSEAMRLLKQGGVRINGEVVRDASYSVEVGKDTILQIGKNYSKRLIFKKN